MSAYAYANQLFEEAAAEARKRNFPDETFCRALRYEIYRHMMQGRTKEDVLRELNYEISHLSFDEDVPMGRDQ